MFLPLSPFSAQRHARIETSVGCMQITVLTLSLTLSILLSTLTVIDV